MVIAEFSDRLLICLGLACFEVLDLQDELVVVIKGCLKTKV